MKVHIYDDEGNKGFIVYDIASKDLLVSFPSKIIRRKIYKYLTESRVELFPTEEFDGKTWERFTPVDNIHKLTYALCGLVGGTGVKVDWDCHENHLPHIEKGRTEIRVRILE